MKKLLETYKEKGFNLKNHVVMAPMTRSRAIDSLPNALMAKYYGQRTSAGLIITEGTAPTPEALGYPRIPGIFSPEQVDGWKKVTTAVHQGGSKIFLQLMHVGRIGHKDNLPEGIDLVSASAQKANGQIFTDTKGLQEFSPPVALTEDGIRKVIEGHVVAAKNAIVAGFDGIEIHGANGYLIEQFLNPHINTRTDQYGGSIENRARLAVEIIKHIANAIGKEKVGIRFSPFSTFNDQPAYAEDEVHETYEHLAREMDKIGIAYLHISGSPKIPQETYESIRGAFQNTIILCNGLTPETATQKLQEGFADLAAFARSFLANPDFVERIAKDAPLNEPRMDRAYTPGSRGYTDYPTLA